MFSGTNDRFIQAYDDATGQLLWQTPLNDLPSSSPISYMVNGKQYLAVIPERTESTVLPFFSKNLALSKFILARQTPLRRSCRTDRSDSFHRVPRRT